jgi:hypothetical protein
VTVCVKWCGVPPTVPPPPLVSSPILLKFYDQILCWVSQMHYVTIRHKITRQILPCLNKLLTHNGGFVGSKLTWRSSFSVANKLQGLRTKEMDLDSWWGQIFFFSPQLPDQLWGPPSLLSNLHRVPFPESKRLCLAIWPPTPKCLVDILPPLLHICCATSRTVPASIPGRVTGFFSDLFPSD